MTKNAPILNGLKLRCGACGEGKLFNSFLKLKSECPSCTRDMTSADTADGPAFFVGFGVTILLAPFLFLLPMTPFPLIWKVISMIILSGVLVAICLALLPIAKAILLNLQLHHNAEQATFSSDDS